MPEKDKQGDPGHTVVTAPAMVEAPRSAPAQVGDLNTAPTTTAAEDLTKKGQRFVNLIWEFVQACIAGGVVSVTLFVSSKLALVIINPAATEKQAAAANMAFMLISNLASLIVGFYFGRTNHQKTGGVGSSDTGR